MPGGVGAVVDLLQFALLAAAAAGLFHYVPNTHVRAVHAWSGGLFVALAFEGAKEVLAWYVRSVPTFSAIYGAFATLPILLLWIYLVWVIVLLGAVMAAYAPSLSMRIVLRPAAPGQRFTLAVEMLGRLEGRAPHAHARAGLRRARGRRCGPTRCRSSRSWTCWWSSAGWRGWTSRARRATCCWLTRRSRAAGCWWTGYCWSRPARWQPSANARGWRA
jgi:hypothetical protein